MPTSGPTWFCFEFGNLAMFVSFGRAAPSPLYHSHPPIPLRAAVAPARWKNDKLVFPWLENEDSHGIPMEQHSGEIESTTKHYTNTRTHAPTHEPKCACLHPFVITLKVLHTQFCPSYPENEINGPMACIHHLKFVTEIVWIFLCPSQSTFYITIQRNFGRLA